MTSSPHTCSKSYCFKLLGINISNDLGWDAHVDALCSNSNSFNRAITNSKKRRWTFVGSNKNLFFCLITVNSHTVVCRPSEEVVQVL